MVNGIRVFALAAGFAIGAAGMAAAAPITVSVFNLADYQAYVNSLAADRVVEDFETLGGAGDKKVLNGQREVGGVGTPLATAVGGIQTLGGTGTGRSVLQTDGASEGTTLALRNVVHNFGRVNTTSPGKWFLDSNDTTGMSWAVNIGQAFNQIAFTLSDASDAGALLEIMAPGQKTVTPYMFTEGDGKRTNGIVNLVIVSFGELINSATLTLTNRNRALTGTQLNDGFAIDDLTVGTIAAVPLPAGALLLLTAMGGFAVARSRRKAA